MIARPAARPVRLFAAGAVVAQLLGCSDPASPVERLDVGTLAYGSGEEAEIRVPDTVDVDVPFVVSVKTYGNSCWRVGPTETAVVEGRPVVTPLDWVTTGGVCQDVQLTFDHSATVSVEQPGRTAVVVRGRIGELGPIRSFEVELWVR